MADNAARLLLAEDEILIAMEIQDSLEYNDYEVCGIAATAPEAVKLADRHKPILALVDVNLANGTNGLDAVREMRENLGTPSIIVSGHANEIDARRAGAVGWIAKPFRADDLLALVAYAVAIVSGKDPPGPQPSGFIEPPHPPERAAFAT